MNPLRKSRPDPFAEAGHISTRARLRDELQSGLEYRFEASPWGFNAPGYSVRLYIRNRHDFPIVIRECRFDTSYSSESVVVQALPFTLEAGGEIEIAGGYVNVAADVVSGPAWKPLIRYDLDYAADLGSFSFSGRAEFGAGRRRAS